jgi:hypothetical protein
MPGIGYSGVPLMFGAGLALWLLLSRYNIRELSSRAITSLSGHFRARPDPWLECALREAFDKFDRELTAILCARDLLRTPGVSPARGPADQVDPADPVDPVDKADPPGPAA